MSIDVLFRSVELGRVAAPQLKVPWDINEQETARSQSPFIAKSLLERLVEFHLGAMWNWGFLERGVPPNHSFLSCFCSLFFASILGGTTIYGNPQLESWRISVGRIAHPMLTAHSDGGICMWHQKRAFPRRQLTPTEALVCFHLGQFHHAYLVSLAQLQKVSSMHN